MCGVVGPQGPLHRPGFHHNLSTTIDQVSTTTSQAGGRGGGPKESFMYRDDSLDEQRSSFHFISQSRANNRTSHSLTSAQLTSPNFLSKPDTTTPSPRFSHLPIWPKIWKKGNGWKWVEVSKSPLRLPFIVNKNHSERRGTKRRRTPRCLRCRHKGHLAKDCNRDPPIRWVPTQDDIHDQLPTVASKLRLEEIILEGVSSLHRDALNSGVHRVDLVYVHIFFRCTNSG